ncbi:hypothetical protein OUZ56_024848 [Daphnia magna]|uniref:Uncharacterized protein n=1 Tax=Daphnia magna TaxID=35525 RepID=A0ABQ9ZIU1_9CRUS|nr:hypothetical protein OUZ56_024848 [Daphnia magna]
MEDSYSPFSSRHVTRIEIHLIGNSVLCVAVWSWKTRESIDGPWTVVTRRQEAPANDSRVKDRTHFNFQEPMETRANTLSFHVSEIEQQTREENNLELRDVCGSIQPKSLQRGHIALHFLSVPSAESIPVTSICIRNVEDVGVPFSMEYHGPAGIPPSFLPSRPDFASDVPPIPHEEVGVTLFFTNGVRNFVSA